MKTAISSLVAVGVTAAIYLLPVPFKGTLLLACGVYCGRLSAKLF